MVCIFTSRFTVEVTTSKDRGCKLDGGSSPPTHPPLLLHGIIGWTPTECADGIGIDLIRSYVHVYLLDCGLFHIDWTGSGSDVGEQENR